MRTKFKKFTQIFLLFFLTLLVSCNKEKVKLDPNRGLSAEEKRVQNIREGRGASINSILKIGEKLITNLAPLILCGEHRLKLSIFYH